MKSLDSVSHDARPSNKKRNEATHSGVTALNHKVTFPAEIMYTTRLFLLYPGVSQTFITVLSNDVCTLLTQDVMHVVTPSPWFYLLVPVEGKDLSFVPF